MFRFALQHISTIAKNSTAVPNTNKNVPANTSLAKYPLNKAAIPHKIRIIPATIKTTKTVKKSIFAHLFQHFIPVIVKFLSSFKSITLPLSSFTTGQSKQSELFL